MSLTRTEQIERRSMSGYLMVAVGLVLILAGAAMLLRPAGRFGRWSCYPCIATHWHPADGGTPGRESRRRRSKAPCERSG